MHCHNGNNICVPQFSLYLFYKYVLQDFVWKFKKCLCMSASLTHKWQCITFLVRMVLYNWAIAIILVSKYDNLSWVGGYFYWSKMTFGFRLKSFLGYKLLSVNVKRSTYLFSANPSIYHKRLVLYSNILVHLMLHWWLFEQLNCLSWWNGWTKWKLLAELFFNIIAKDFFIFVEIY